MKFRTMLCFSIVPAWLLTSCAGMVKAGLEATEEVYTSAPATSTPLPGCDASSTVVIGVEPIDADAIILNLSGLAAEEQVDLVFEPIPVPDEGTIVVESRPAKPADSRGQLQIHQGHLGADQQPNTWLVRVIHQNGVACTEFTLPDGAAAESGG